MPGEEPQRPGMFVAASDRQDEPIFLEPTVLDVDAENAKSGSWDLQKAEALQELQRLALLDA